MDEQHEDEDVCMDNYSESWIESLFSPPFTGKRVICTPYIPVSTPRNAEHVLFVHVRGGNITKEVQHGYMAPVRGEPFFVRWGSGGLTITCNESTPMKNKGTTLQENEIDYLTQHTMTFSVDTRTINENKVILHFILKQSTRTKQLLVPMHLEANPNPGPSDVSSNLEDAAGQLLQPKYTTRQDVCMDHYSESWIESLFSPTSYGKRVICTPYIPVSTPRNAELVLFVHVRDENIGNKVQHGYMAPVPGEPFFVRRGSGGLTITCNESTPMKNKGTVTDYHLRHIDHLTDQKVMFKVDTRTADMNTVILHFVLKQSTRTKQLLVPMHLEDNVMIRLEKHGIVVRIPPNQAYRTTDVTVDPIYDIPPELVLKEPEVIICIGLRMSPSTYATFDDPVTVTMPHCGIFTKPEAAEVVTYYRNSAIPSSNGSPRCVVRHHDLDCYLDHFSEVWIVALITRVFIGKRVICTPYIPVSTPRNAEHVLFVHVRDENIGKEVEHGYMAPISGEQFLVRWRSGGLRITCNESTPMLDEVTTLQESEIRHLSKHKVMFTVNTRTTDTNEVMLHFIMKQSTTKQLIVPMHLEGRTNISLGNTGSASLILRPPTSVAIPLYYAVAAARVLSTPQPKTPDSSLKREVSDALLNKVARYIPSYAYDTLSEKLGIEHNQARNILVQDNSDYEKATGECIAKWRDRSTRSVADLHDVLRKAELGGLISQL